MSLSLGGSGGGLGRSTPIAAAVSAVVRNSRESHAAVAALRGVTHAASGVDDDAAAASI